MLLIRRFSLIALAASLCVVSAAHALTIKVDYSADTNGFFGASNPQGAAAGMQAKAAMDAAAAFYSGIVDDTLSPIVAPYFVGKNGSVTWSWTVGFVDPQSDSNTTRTNLPLNADEYVVFVGTKQLGTSTLGVGGPGGSPGWSRNPTGVFTAGEQGQIDAIHNDFLETLNTRGESDGFVSWGGVLSFDVDTNWHFNHTTAVQTGKSDFYTVAVHELGHALGFGTSQEWNSYVDGTTFIGPAAMATYHAQGPVPLASAANTGHWSLVNTGSTVYGGSAPQQPIMSPSIPNGTRRFLTDLDAAGLVDIGWEIELPESVPGDYNDNGVVDAGDYAVWRDTLGSTTDLRANGDNTGASANKVDQADYNFWKSHFGSTGSGGGSVAYGVPEPATGVLMLFASLVAYRLRQSHIYRSR